MFHTLTLHPQRKEKTGSGWLAGCVSQSSLVLLFVLELIGQPVKALIEAIATGGARGLDVPVAVAEGV